MIRLLITSSGGTLIPILTKFLKKDHQLGKIYIVGIDKKKIKKNSSIDKFYCLKTSQKKKYIFKLLSVCKKERINVLIPYSDFEAKIISEFKRKFLKLGIKTLVNDKSITDIISNKYLTYSILKKKGVQVPKFKLVKNLKQLRRSLIEFNYPKLPVVIKPSHSIGGRGVLILNGKKQKIAKWINGGKREKIFHKEKKIFSKKIFNYGPLLIMEALNAPAYDIDCYVQKKNKLVIIRKRINPAGIPYRGNYLIKDRKIKNYCKKIIETLKINSLVDIDLLTSKEGNPLLLEVNPRPSGSAVIAHLANLPIFSYVIAKILNKKYSINFSKVKFNRKLKLSV